MASLTVGPEAVGAIADALYQPAFPAAWAVPLAVATVQDAAGVQLELGELHEGPRWWLSVGPGRIRIGSTDYARCDRTRERGHGKRHKRVEEGASWIADAPTRAALGVLAAAGLEDVSGLAPSLDPLAPGPARTRITEWSSKSRALMVDRLSTLDYLPLIAPGVPAMVTLTLPDDWEVIAPTGRAFKALVRAFLERYRRAWGQRLRGLWKLEFQRRGAPHLHVLMVPPNGDAGGLRWREWFAGAWSSIVVEAYRKNSDRGSMPARDFGELYRKIYAVHVHRSASSDYAEGLRAADPKRVAVYFLKHNLLRDKDYQHIVPEAWRGEGDGPGRFWGYWQLDRADRAASLTYDQAVAAARLLRRLEKSRGGFRRASVFRTDTKTGAVSRRTVLRRRTPRLRTSGFVVLNDGPAVALMVADWLGRLN